MPSTGIPARRASGSTCGAPASYPLPAPPPRINPTGARFYNSDQGVVPGTSSQYTFASRTRRAISWLNCDPKSRTRTVCWFFNAGTLSRGSPFTVSRCWAAAAVMLRSALPHAHVLGLLKNLALRGDRRRDDHLHVLELGDVAGATHAERRAQRPGEVLAAVVDASGTEQDLSQGRLRPDVDPCAPRKVGVRRGHAPVEASRRGFLGAGQRRADHDGVRTGCECLANVGADPHAPVGDHRHSHATAAHVLVPSRRDISGGGHLRHTNAEDASRGARGARPNSHENACDAGLHQLQRGVVADAIADDDGDVGGAN